MTMHLMSPAFNTTSTRKNKSKNIKIDEKFTREWREHNKSMQKYKLKTKTLEEYVLYCQGKYNPKVTSSTSNPMQASSLQRESPEYNTTRSVGVGYARKENTYTGTLIKGIAVTHKSNLIPITSQQQAEDVARMRRG